MISILYAKKSIFDDMTRWVMCCIIMPLWIGGLAQCDPHFSNPLSPRIANYNIKVRVDPDSKQIHAEEVIKWTNTSPDTVVDLRFHMYINAFKNTSSTFIKGSGNQIFGNSILERKASEWGWIRMDSVFNVQDKSLAGVSQYIQPDDRNKDDQSVLQLVLTRPILPGETREIKLFFTAQMPKTFVRVGYSKDDYFLFVQWFPKLGVYEQDVHGQWKWNCHQFFRQTEFYADFGVYDVTVEVPTGWVVGASGCLVGESEIENGWTRRRYVAEDVIDFAWVLYPHFSVVTDRWNNVEIRLLIPPEHKHFTPRFIKATKASLAYLDEHVGPYPYPIITVVDPPFHALRSGLMEYPTLITTGSMYGMPESLRSLEALVAHEFAHQYFMALLASNEKEEAWLDEGLVTYFEDKIIDYTYGEQSSMFNVMGYQSGNRALTRLEYTGLGNPKAGIIARPGWEIEESFKGFVYSKTATWLHTLEGMLGQETMKEIFQTYFQRWKFRHPRGKDFLSVINEIVEKRNPNLSDAIRSLNTQILTGTDICDYAIGDIQNIPHIEPIGLFDLEGDVVFKKGRIDGSKWNSMIKIYRLGGISAPVDIEVYYENGKMEKFHWSGLERTHILRISRDSRVEAACVDPAHKLYIDRDFNNNSKTAKPKKNPLYKYASKTVFWVQNVLQTISWLI